VLKDVADNLRTNRSADLPRNDSHQASLHSPMKKPYHFSFNNKAKEEMQPASENVVSDIENRQGKPHHPSINKKAQSHLNSQITISETTEIDNSSKSDAVADVVHDSYSAKKDTIVSTKNEQPTAKNANVDTGKNTSHKQNRASKSFKRSFSIGVGAGPDVSGVNLDNTGKVTFAYGAQLGYTFSKNFTIRTGFYVARKIYSADAADYHQQGGGNYNYLSSVNANCKVYEIPLTVSYNFGDVKKHAWFVSTGLSSYFMKKESYEYFYKDPSGVTYNTSWSVSNKNQHYLSVLDICGGYMYFVNKQFSLIAEPSLKLPLAGIGVGKIKLNSAGILFTVAIKPFN
jgi:hypothetical protein